MTMTKILGDENTGQAAGTLDTPDFRDLYRQCSRRHALLKGPDEVKACVASLIP
jgi:hypothetical protein